MALRLVAADANEYVTTIEANEGSGIYYYFPRLQKNYPIKKHQQQTFYSHPIQRPKTYYL